MVDNLVIRFLIGIGGNSNWNVLGICNYRDGRVITDFNPKIGIQEATIDYYAVDKDYLSIEIHKFIEFWNLPG